MNQHLGVPLNPFIELLVGDFGFVDADLVADDEGWFGFS